MVKKKIKLLFNPKFILLNILNLKLFRIIPDKTFLKIKYRLLIDKKLNLSNPKTFNEKIQWLKLYDRNPIYTQLVDKYEVRKHISKTIGEDYLIPLLGVYDTFDDIDFNMLPNQFVLKPNHTSGDVYICKDKSKIDYTKLEKIVKKWLKRKYYWLHREWPYKNIKPKIICEKYMVDESSIELKDYKFLCFNGEPKIIQVMSGRNNGNYFINHFDLEWNKVEINRKSHIENPEKIRKPERLKEMIDISRVLSKNIKFCRIDLYNTESGIYFGEITLYPASGYMDFENEKDDYLLGSYLELPDL